MACPDDPTLFALVRGDLSGNELSELDSHLDSCESCRELVASLVSGARERVLARELARGDAVGRFLVIAPIGRGAMGIVYAAYDPELDRRVALKLLHADEGDGSRARARLVREAQALARLSHPSVVTVYDVGARGGEIYLALELVEGENLRGWLSREPRTTDAILGVFLQAGEGLAAAHAAGLVHRDFKPENVLVDRSGRAKVTDFGLARGASTEHASVPLEPSTAILDASLTRSGALLGTPAYMPPEQLRGEPADARADQFAFAVALHEALAGERPFSGSSVGELSLAIESGPPALVSSRAPRRVIDALRRALAARPDDRFADLDALLAALRPSPARGRSVALYGVAALIVVSGAVAWLARAPDAPACGASVHAIAGVWNEGARDRLTHAFDEGATREAGAHLASVVDRWSEAWTRARIDACEATHVRREQSEALLDRRMGCLDAQRSALEVLLARFERPDPQALWFATEAAATLPEVGLCADAAFLASRVAPPSPAIASRVAELRRSLDEARLHVATAEASAALARTAELVRDAELLDYGPALAEAWLARADALRAAARYAESEQASQAGLVAAETAGDDRSVASAWLALVRSAGAAGRYTEADGFARHLEATVRRAGSPEDLRRDLHLVRGVVRMELGQLDASEADLEDALRLAESRYGEGDPRLAPIETSLGNLARLDGRFDVALAHHERALELDRAALGASHPRVGRDLHNVAGVLRRIDRVGEARVRYEEARAIKQAALGAHPEVALTLNSLGLLEAEAGNYDAARGRYEAALTIFEAHEHADAALARYNIALLELSVGRPAEARSQLERALAIDEVRLGPRAKRVAGERIALGRALSELGDLEGARRELERAAVIGAEIGDDDVVTRADEALRAMAPVAPREPESAPRRAGARRAFALAEPAVEPIRTPPIEPAIEPAIEPRPVAPVAPAAPGRTGSSGYAPGQPWE